MDNLKPCPFCGGTNVSCIMHKPVGSGEYFVVLCSDCSGQMKRSSKRKAIEAWNRRKGEGE